MKSIFFRYVAVFSLIILISFLMLSSIISASIDDFAADARKSDVTLIAKIASSYLEEEYSARQEGTFEDMTVDISADLRSMLRSIAADARNMGFVVVATDGKLLLHQGVELTSPTGRVDAKYLPTEKDEGLYVETGTLGHLLKHSHVICADLIESPTGQAVGTVFACSSTFEDDALIATLNRSIFLSNLWVMLALIIAVYFITERLLAPLREMREAAKNFANDKFDTRVAVIGNDEIADFAEAFNNMAESLEQSEKLRSTFLANVSHDLRTPMTTIAGFIDGILSGAIPEDKHTYYLGVVSEEVHRLSRLVSQLLDISRMETGVQKFTPTDFDLCEIARLTLISFEGKIEAKRLEVELFCDEDTMMAYADRDAIHQIIYNIVENAVKFSHEGGLLRISVKAGESGKYEFEVYNEGQGIPQEDLPYIFDRFYKTDKSRGLDKIGVGLGLYIAKTILSANGERIWVESEEGKYCSFHFTVRRAN